MELTHASFFSGVGGLDLGLERAGWRTVSFSEIDPYASAVLAERWPGVPNLGDILRLRPAEHAVDAPDGRQPERNVVSEPWTRAALWSGGFPCQDLSVAGKRRGLAGSRSGLAFAFLELVGRHRPPLVLLENVPGLLSSHGGRDMAALLGALVELGYGVGYRVLDARHFGVPQRRRRVFIVGVTPGGRAGAERAAEVLSVGSRCRRHPPTGVEAGEGVADGAAPDADVVGTLGGDFGHHGGALGSQVAWQGHLRVGSSPDPRRVRAADGLAGRLDDRELAATLNSNKSGGWRYDADPAQNLVAYGKVTRPHGPDGDGERWDSVDLASTRNSFDNGDVRAVELIAGPGSVSEDALLPLGLDSHRYRCCGNGVVADVAEWLGWRLREAVA